MATTNLSNDRIFYATQAVAIAPFKQTSTAYNKIHMAHGLQSIGITTNFNLEQVFELGQLEIYENVEGIPDVEVTMEKVVDGYPLLFHMATTGNPEDGFVAATKQNCFLERSKQRCDVRLGIYEENKGNNVVAAGASGAHTATSAAQQTEVYFSGMYINSVSYSMPVDGPMTESVTLVGNNKQWLHSSLDENVTGPQGEDGILPFQQMALASGGASQNANGNQPTQRFNGDDSPLARTSGTHLDDLVLASGGVQRREDVLLEISTLPKSIRGVNGTSRGNAYNASTKVPRVHLQSFSASTDMGREDVLELGRKNPYARTANFPIEVTCDIEAITAEGDFVNALEEGDPALFTTLNSGENTPDETIKLVTRGGTVVDLGGRNRLSSVSYGGGDAGGGNATCTYSYTNFNSFEIRQQPQLKTDKETFKADNVI